MKFALNLAGRALALCTACLLAIAWWHANGIPDLVYRTYSIGRNSPMLDRFIGFLSIIGTFTLIFALIVAIIACLSYASNPSTSVKLASKVKREACNFDLAKRTGGIVVIFAGLFVWFLAYLLPDYSVSLLYHSRVPEPLRTILGMTSVACMFAGAALGLAFTVSGGMLTFAPCRVRSKS